MTTTTEETLLELADAPSITGLRFRRPRGDDADYAAMAAIVTAANLSDGIEWAPTARQLRDELEASAGIDPATDVVIAELDGRTVAEASVERTIRDGVAVFQVSGHVDPDLRRRGLGRALMRENLRRATERATAEPAGQAIEARAVAAESDAGHRAVLSEHGFEPIRWSFLMRRPSLDEVPDAPLPEGLELRPVSADQHRAIFEAEVEAFRDHWSAREKTDEDFELMLGRKELDTDLWVVAWEGDEVAGVVQNWIWPDENAAIGVARGWLEHISVRRPWRRRRLGRAITAESLRRLAAAGMTEAMLGVDAENPTGALGLYEGLGFEVHQRWITYRRTLGS